MSSQLPPSTPTSHTRPLPGSQANRQNYNFNPQAVAAMHSLGNMYQPANASRQAFVGRRSGETMAPPPRSRRTVASMRPHGNMQPPQKIAAIRSQGNMGHPRTPQTIRAMRLQGGMIRPSINQQPIMPTRSQALTPQAIQAMRFQSKTRPTTMINRQTPTASFLAVSPQAVDAVLAENAQRFEAVRRAYIPEPDLIAAMVKKNLEVQDIIKILIRKHPEIVNSGDLASWTPLLASHVQMVQAARSGQSAPPPDIKTECPEAYNFPPPPKDNPFFEEICRTSPYYDEYRNAMCMKIKINEVLENLRVRYEWTLEAEKLLRYLSTISLDQSVDVDNALQRIKAMLEEMEVTGY